MKILLLLGAIVLTGAGCSGMTNDEVILETKKCEDAGMMAEVLVREIDSAIAAVQCSPKHE